MFCTNTNNAIFYTSIKDIPENIWSELNCSNDIYFNAKYLLALEKNNTNIEFSYIVLLDKFKKAIAFASIQIIDLDLNNLKSNIEGFSRKIQLIAEKARILPSKSLKILMCGNTFVSGEHGVFIKNNQDKKKTIKELAKAILHFVNSHSNLNKEVTIFLIKDFINKSLAITNQLKDYNYHPLIVEPNMVLHIDKSWETQEDYLASMKTKFRVKAKKALKLSNNLVVKNITLENIEQKLPEMTSLYKTVASKANFNLGDFSLDTYKDLLLNFKDNYILQAYYLDDKIVGFISGIINNNTLDAHYVGIDYNLNREYAIYQRMLYDYINIAIKKQLTLLNFGRTASEIKSSVGAVPEDLTIYLRHKKSIKNKILKLFLQKIEPTPFKQKFPFKKIEK